MCILLFTSVKGLETGGGYVQNYKAKRGGKEVWRKEKKVKLVNDDQQSSLKDGIATNLAAEKPPPPPPIKAESCVRTLITDL